jgi:hypothetical protein
MSEQRANQFESEDDPTYSISIAFEGSLPTTRAVLRKACGANRYYIYYQE